MAKVKQGVRQEQRRAGIREAARDCFLSFGYSRTSLEDIANKAGISRPLIYLQYESKEAVLTAVFEELFRDRYPAAEKAAAGTGSRRDRLLRVYEIMVLEPWRQLMVNPAMAREFYEACEHIAPESEAKMGRGLLRCVRGILGSKARAAVFVMAAEGLQGDLPTVEELRRRLWVLIEAFAG